MYNILFASKDANVCYENASRTSDCSADLFMPLFHVLPKNTSGSGSHMHEALERVLLSFLSEFNA